MTTMALPETNRANDNSARPNRDPSPSADQVNRPDPPTSCLPTTPSSILLEALGMILEELFTI